MLGGLSGARTSNSRVFPSDRKDGLAWLSPVGFVNLSGVPPPSETFIKPGKPPLANTITPVEPQLAPRNEVKYGIEQIMIGCPPSKRIFLNVAEADATST